MTKAESSLTKALEFVALAQKDKGAPYQTHVVLDSHMAVGYDGILAAGHPIDEELQACPHTFTLLAALKRCEGVLSVTQLPTARLSVRAGKFRAFVRCADVGLIPRIAPDPQVGVLSNVLKDGLRAITPIIVENSPRVVMAAALLQANTVSATNNQIILEYWHGFDLPPNLIIPKLFINALLKIDYDIVGFGFSSTTFTLHFSNGSWLKTQLYVDKWPDVARVFNDPCAPIALPEGFFHALNQVMPFVEDNRVRLRDGQICTHADAQLGGQHDVPGLIATATYNAKHLALLEPLIQTVDFTNKNGVTYFFGDRLRGAMTVSREV